MKRLPKLLLFALLLASLLALPLSAQAVCPNSGSLSSRWGAYTASYGSSGGTDCTASGTCGNTGNTDCALDGSCGSAGTTNCALSGTCGNTGNRDCALDGSCSSAGTTDCALSGTCGNTGNTDCTLGGSCGSGTTDCTVGDCQGALWGCGTASQSGATGGNSYLGALLSYLLGSWQRGGGFSGQNIATYYNIDNMSDSTATVSQPAGTDSLPVSASDFAAQVVTLVNAERAAAGLPALTVDPQLSAGAMTRAGELSTLFSHTRPDGSSCFTALNQAGATYRQAGENIAIGQQTPAQVVEDWLNSPGHRANILSADFTRIGVAALASTDPAYGGYAWAQFFAD